MVKYSFVIPCYNSAGSIEQVVKEIFAAMEHIDPSFEIILVNDHSSDNAKEIIFNLANQYPNIKAISFIRNFGQHAALMAGYRAAEGEYIISMDDDGQTPADQISLLINEINKGPDVVFARYKTPKETLFRRIGSTVNDLMAVYLLGKPRDLSLTSFFIAKRAVINEVIKYQKAYPYIAGQILRATSNISNVYIDHRERMVGRSGYSLFKLIHLWLNGVTITSLRPLRLMLMAIILFVCFLIWLCLFAFRKRLGWAFIALLILVITACLSVVFFLLGEYLDRVNANKSGRPQYLIEDTAGFNK